MTVFVTQAFDLVTSEKEKVMPWPSAQTPLLAAYPGETPNYQPQRPSDVRSGAERPAVPRPGSPG